MVLAAMPIISAKNITAIRSPLAAASTTLRGTTLSRIWMPLGASRALATIWPPRSLPASSRVLPMSGESPTPGWITFTSSRPIATAIEVPSRIHSRVLPPIRPSAEG